LYVRLSYKKKSFFGFAKNFYIICVYVSIIARGALKTKKEKLLLTQYFFEKRVAQKI
jgi:hypothetical protein